MDAAAAPGLRPLAFPRAATPPSAREIKREASLPNLALLDQAGQPRRFYDDLVRDRQVLIHVLYSACENACPPTVQHLLQARALLGAQGAALRPIGITLTPVADDPRALQAFARAQGLPPDWTLLTGPPATVEALLRALRFWPDEGREQPLTEHARMAWVGDEAAVKWGRVMALQPPRAVARMIRFALA